LESLKGLNVLLIGAGGAARAVVFHLIEVLDSGSLTIANRTVETSRFLAVEAKRIFQNVNTIGEDELDQWVSKTDLIINCSTKGQGGIRRISDGKITVLEPYSALGTANPATFPESDESKPEFYHNWMKASLADIESNNHASQILALSTPLYVPFCDLIYYPSETVFLRHARLSGHRTLNGKGMIVAQAADALFNKVCRRFFERSAAYDADTYRRVLAIMHEAW
jgi:shikimate 5-dehydrogenase